LYGNKKALPKLHKRLLLCAGGETTYFLAQGNFQRVNRVAFQGKRDPEKQQRSPLLGRFKRSLDVISARTAGGLSRFARLSLHQLRAPRAGAIGKDIDLYD
jgi:hypothetical protein